MCDDNLLGKHGYHPVIEALQIIIDCDQKGPQNISPWVVEKSKELAIIYQLRRQLDQYQPWAGWRRGETKKIAQDRYSYRAQLEQRLKNNIEKYCFDHPLDPNSPDLRYPESPEGSSIDAALAWEKQRHKAETHMDRFWMGLHQTLGHAADDGTSQPAPEKVPYASILVELYEMRFWVLGNERTKASFQSSTEPVRGAQDDDNDDGQQLDVPESEVPFERKISDTPEGSVSDSTGLPSDAELAQKARELNVDITAVSLTNF